MHVYAACFVLQCNVGARTRTLAGGGDRSGQLEGVAVRDATVKVVVERFRREERNLSRLELEA